MGIDLEDSNTRVTIQSTDTEFLNALVTHIREKYDTKIMFSTEVRRNNRPPLEDGVHQILYLALELVDLCLTQFLYPNAH